MKTEDILNTSENYLYSLFDDFKKKGIEEHDYLQLVDKIIQDLIFWRTCQFYNTFKYKETLDKDMEDSCIRVNIDSYHTTATKALKYIKKKNKKDKLTK